MLLPLDRNHHEHANHHDHQTFHESKQQEKDALPEQKVQDGHGAGLENGVPWLLHC